MRWCSPYVPTIMAASARCDWMARNLCTASCCMCCPAASTAFATMGCWPVPAKGSSCALHAWLCRCQCPTRRPLSRPTRSWRESPGSMCCCARFADKVVCTLQRCSRAQGDCKHPLARCCLRAGGHPEALFECYESARDRWDLKGTLTVVRGCVARCCTLHRCRPTSTLQCRHGPDRYTRLRQGSATQIPKARS